MVLVGVSLVLAERAHRQRPATSGGGSRIIAACALLATAAKLDPVSAHVHLFRHPACHRRGVGAGHRRWCAGRASALGDRVRRRRARARSGRIRCSMRVRCRGSGSSTAKPATEDYVPLAPWAGVVCLGIAVGAPARAPWIPRRRARSPRRPAGCAGSGGTACRSTWFISRSCSGRCGSSSGA